MDFIASKVPKESSSLGPCKAGSIALQIVLYPAREEQVSYTDLQ